MVIPSEAAALIVFSAPGTAVGLSTSHPGKLRRSTTHEAIRHRESGEIRKLAGIMQGAEIRVKERRRRKDFSEIALFCHAGTSGGSPI